MLQNYFTIAWRTLLNNRLYSTINVFGLTVGISSCLVIFLIVTFELSFNRDIPDAERIYRIYSTFKGDYEGTNRGVSTGVQGIVSSQFIGLDGVSPLYSYSAKVSIPGSLEPTVFDQEKQIVLAQPSYFNVIAGYSWVNGSPDALKEPGKVVLTLPQAKKYFGTESTETIVGRVIHYNDSLIVTVAGLVQTLPGNTDFEFTDFISFATIESSFLKRRITLNDWESTNSSSQLFIKLSPNTSLASVETQINSLDEEYRKHQNPDMGGWALRYKMQPLSDLHYDANLGIFDNSRPAAHLSTLTTLSGVAVILLVLASINFVNLETARAVKRAKEVGIRKVLGSSRSQLMRHFLAQSLLLSLVAVLIAIPVAEMGLIFFNDFIPKGVVLSLSQGPTFLFLVAVVVVVGVLSGLYPAFVLSSFLPALALKNQGYISSANSRSAYMRKGLIIFQFSSAQLLIIGTLVIVSQIHFMLNKDLGFDKEAIIHINAPWQEKPEKRLTLRTELERLPEIESLSLCQSPPAANGFSSNVLTYKHGSEETRKSVMRKFGDANYLSVYGIKLVAGRNLSPNHQSEILVNEAFLREFGITKEQALGQEILENKRTFTIVGIMADYHIFSLHAPFKPVYMCGFEEDLYSLSAKLAVPEHGPRNYAGAIAKIETAWKSVYPERKFSYEFVDETIRNFYQTEQKMSTLAGTAMGIAIIISCLGLFGLASYTSIQRSKEVGIRKVMGATARNILILLSGDFLKLVGIAFIVAAPVAYWGADRFLGDYSFHIELGWALFLYAGVSSMVLAFLTVSYQALKTSFMNPVDSLRAE